MIGADSELKVTFGVAEDDRRRRGSGANGTAFLAGFFFEGEKKSPRTGTAPAEDDRR